MDYVIFDLEWNQTPNDSALVTEPVYLTGEIVEIGAVKLNSRFESIDQLKLYIKPKYYEKMHRKIASLTGISDRKLEQEGLPFPEACEKFFSWCGENFGFMTWSDSDLPVLVENMQLWGLDVSQLPLWYDAQRMFGRELMRTDRQYSLDAALEALGIQGEKAHDALHDCMNTVKVLDRMELQTFLEEYGAQAFAQPPAPKIYESPREILNAPEAAEITCPWCGEKILCRDWVSLPGHRYASMGTCGEGDELLLQIAQLPMPQGGYRIQRMVYEMSDDLYEQYEDRLELQTAAE